MKGSKREKKKGVWQLRAPTGRRTENGSYEYAHRTFHGTARQADRELRDFVDALEAARAETPGDQSRWTTLEVIDRYVKLKAPDISPKTLQEYRRVVEQLTDGPLAGIGAETLTPTQIEDWLETKKPSVADTIRKVCRAAFNRAIEKDMVTRPKNPWVAAEIRAYDKSNADRLVPAAAIQEAIDLCISRDDYFMASLIRFATVTGCRRGELCGLQWGDIGWGLKPDGPNEPTVVTVRRAVVQDSNQIYVKGTKTDRPKIIAIDDTTARLLDRWELRLEVRCEADGVDLQPTDHVWPHERGRGPMWPSSLTRKWSALRAELPALAGFRLHDLRHTMISNALAAGYDARAVADRAGHAKPTMTLDRYSHALPARDAALADELGSGLS